MSTELICTLSKDRLFSRILQERMTPLGARVALAADSGQAMKRLAWRTPSLLVCDLQSAGAEALKLRDLISQDVSLLAVDCLLLHGGGLRQRFWLARAGQFAGEAFRVGEVGWDYLTETIRQRLRIAAYCREHQVSRKAVGGHVLCVDRDRSCLRQLELDLRQRGLTVHAEQSGLRAVESARQRRPGLILAEFSEVHWVMSQLAARDVSVPVIALADVSASAFPEFRQDVLELGARDVLRKPLDRELLMQSIQQVLPLPGFAPSVPTPVETPRHQPHQHRPHISLRSAAPATASPRPTGQPHIQLKSQEVVPVEY